MRALALALVLIAATPVPTSTPKLEPHPPIPKVAEHAEFVVEVNAKGQVVRVTSAKGTGAKDTFFNAQTYGNVMQMWIRHPDGSAEVGLYKVTYDYDPKTKKVTRGVSLVRAGGNWGNEEGAADRMMDTADREYQEGLKAQQQTNKNLPPLEGIIGPTPSPTPHP
ncbi:MAG TPA: hypothetical protein VMA98_07325 [Candidatus Acidoferrales bacterium]|nr:hypothetical protein [Candidatus Acidoferrales bacterium]